MDQLSACHPDRGPGGAVDCGGISPAGVVIFRQFYAGIGGVIRIYWSQLRGSGGAGTVDAE